MEGVSLRRKHVRDFTEKPLDFEMKHLPPKSPSSKTGLFVFGGNASKSLKPKRQHRRRRKGESSKNAASSELSGESFVDELLEVEDPGRMLFVADADDLSSTADFSKVSFPKPDPLKTDRNSSHRRSKSWDSSYSFEVPSFFRRQQKVKCATKLSNASDTIVSVQDNGKITGRELHENAKTVLNSGDLQSAVDMFETLQKAQQERFGQDHSSVGAAMHNVGVVRLLMGEHHRAEEILVQAVAIRRKVLGNDHLDLAASLGKLGSARILCKKFDDALLNLREAMRIIRQTVGHYHKTMAQMLCTLACLFFEAGEFFSSQATFEDALDIYRHVFPTESDRNAAMRKITDVMCNIGSIQNKRKNFSGAIAQFTQALDLQRGIMGHDNPRVIATLDNLGYSFSKNKSNNKAVSCYKEMLNAQLSHYNGKFTLECCETLKKQILIHEKLNDASGALKAAKKAMAKALEQQADAVCIHELENILSQLHLKVKRQRQRY